VTELRDALSAEARGDSLEALRLFQRASGSLGESGSASASEELELAQRGRRACLLRLGRWGELRAATEALVQPGGDGLGTWRESAHEPWVRMLLVSRAKEGAAGQGWRSWVEERAEGAAGGAGEACAPHPVRDSSLLLDAGLGALLVLDRLAAGSEDGARSLLPGCVQAFVSRWAALHPRATMVRLKELEQLQLLAEVWTALLHTSCCEQELEQLQLLAEANELLDVLKRPLLAAAGTGRWVATDAVAALARTWSGRYPSSSQHGAAVWDDVVSSRALLFSVLERRLNEALDAVDFDDEDERAAIRQGSLGAAKRCIAESHERAARALRMQGDFEPAKGHLLASMALRKADPKCFGPVSVQFQAGLLQHTVAKARASRNSGELLQIWQQVRRPDGPRNASLALPTPEALSSTAGGEATRHVRIQPAGGAVRAGRASGRGCATDARRRRCRRGRAPANRGHREAALAPRLAPRLARRPCARAAQARRPLLRLPQARARDTRRRPRPRRCRRGCACDGRRLARGTRPLPHGGRP